MLLKTAWFLVWLWLTQPDFSSVVGCGRGVKLGIQCTGSLWSAPWRFEYIFPLCWLGGFFLGKIEIVFLDCPFPLSFFLGLSYLEFVMKSWTIFCATYWCIFICCIHCAARHILPVSLQYVVDIFAVSDEDALVKYYWQDWESPDQICVGLRFGFSTYYRNHVRFSVHYQGVFVFTIPCLVFFMFLRLVVINFVRCNFTY